MINPAAPPAELHDHKSQHIMKTKTLCLTALLAAASLGASAQGAGNVRFGVTGGMNVSNFTNTGVDDDWRIGFNAGVRAEIGLPSNFYVGTGLIYSMKGDKFTFDKNYSVAALKTTIKNNPGYLELPIQVGYHYSLGGNVGLFAETGPYLAVGVSGKTKTTVEGNVAGIKGSDDKSVDFFGDDGAKRFDGGWAVRFGVEASGFQVHVGYEYGFAKMYDGDESSHNSSLAFGVSYFF